jgi:hypothetical protein
MKARYPGGKAMNTKTIALRYFVASCLVLLTACSGGNVNFEISGPDISPMTLPWTDEPITAYGVNAGQGQIVVNDIVYGTNHATVTVNGRWGVVSELRRGQVITISGDIYGGSFSATADRIDYSAKLIGPVQSLDGPGKRIIAMGQTVISTTDTFFGAGIDPQDYAGLAVGTNIEVSGFIRESRSFEPALYGQSPDRRLQWRAGHRPAGWCSG